MPEVLSFIKRHKGTRRGIGQKIHTVFGGNKVVE
jgi:hypothetical protein